MKTNSDLNLKAVILVGGFGTRLRPLTFYKPKPLVEFCNIPTLTYQIEALAKLGVNEIVVAINYQPEKLQKYIDEACEKFNIRIVCSKEEIPLGTAGPIALARDNFFKNQKFDHLLVFNADIICNYPLQELLDFHVKKGGEGTIYTTKVKDPSKYGVIITDENGKIQSFVEKPTEYISNDINAGMYIFKSSFLDRLETKPTSIEREVFPFMANEGVLYALNLKGIWMDIGQPKDFLAGTILYINDKKDDEVSHHKTFTGKVISHPTVEIEEGALIGPNVVLGEGVKIKAGVRIKNSVILSGTVINSHSFIENSIIGWNNRIGKWVTITGVTISGEDVGFTDEITVDSSLLLPNIIIKTSLQSKTVIC